MNEVVQAMRAAALAERASPTDDSGANPEQVSTDTALDNALPKLRNFGAALVMLKRGENVFRRAWAGAFSVHLEGTELLAVSELGYMAPWHPSVADLLADDWY